MYLFAAWATVVAQWQRTHLVLGSIPSLSILQYWVLNQVPQGGETLLIFQFPHKKGFLAVQLGVNKHSFGQTPFSFTPLSLDVCVYASDINLMIQLYLQMFPSLNVPRQQYKIIVVLSCDLSL